MSGQPGIAVKGNSVNEAVVCSHGCCPISGVSMRVTVACCLAVAESKNIWNMCSALFWLESWQWNMMWLYTLLLYLTVVSSCLYNAWPHYIISSPQLKPLCIVTQSVVVWYHMFISGAIPDTWCVVTQIMILTWMDRRNWFIMRFPKNTGFHPAAERYVLLCPWCLVLSACMGSFCHWLD